MIRDASEQGGDSIILEGYGRGKIYHINKSYKHTDDVNLELGSITGDEKKLLDFIMTNGYTNRSLKKCFYMK